MCQFQGQSRFMGQICYLAKFRISQHPRLYNLKTTERFKFLPIKAKSSLILRLKYRENFKFSINGTNLEQR